MFSNTGKIVDVRRETMNEGGKDESEFIVFTQMVKEPEQYRVRPFLHDYWLSLDEPRDEDDQRGHDRLDLINELQTAHDDAVEVRVMGVLKEKNGGYKLQAKQVRSAMRVAQPDSERQAA